MRHGRPPTSSTLGTTAACPITTLVRERDHVVATQSVVPVVVAELVEGEVHQVAGLLEVVAQEPSAEAKRWSTNVTG